MLENNKAVDLPEPEVLADTKKRAAWVIYQLKLQGMSLAGLGRKYKQSRSIATHALYHPYPAWEYRIAKELGLKPQTLFPERYDKYGLPNRPMGRPKQSAKAEGREVA